MNQARPVLTEKTAAIAFARAINTHDITLLAPLVHDNLHISDQRRWDPRVGAENYLGMLGKYFACVPRERSSTTMELAMSEPPRPCVVEYHHGRPICTVLFQVHAGKIRHIEKRLIPPPTECNFTGFYPGLEEEPIQGVN